MADHKSELGGWVIFAKDVQRVADFYVQTLGLRIVQDESSHYLLLGDQIELVIHSIPSEYAAGIEITNPPRIRAETALKPAFVVEDLSAVREAADASGGGLKPNSGAWSLRGMTVLDGWDPEGNVLQFKQLAPEQAQGREN